MKAKPVLPLLKRLLLGLAAISLFSCPVFASTEKVLHYFAGNSDGADPLAPLASDAAGNLYGTTSSGGSSFEGDIFMLSPNGTGWNYRVIYTFTDCNSACYPSGSLAPDDNGNLYGATSLGGAYNAGTIFELSPNPEGGWVLTPLYDFGASSTDGQRPNGVIYSSGGLYGSTYSGGKFGGGTIFSLTPNWSSGWSETILHSFRLNNIDGNTPSAGVTFDAKGRIYGTTSQGGPNLAGTVFQLIRTRAGTWVEHILHSFSGLDGIMPSSGSLVLDAKGNLYGTTLVGGAGKYGTVFELTPSSGGWTANVLHHFSGGQDGSGPNGVTIDSQGRLFGTTYEGGGRGDCTNPPSSTNEYCGTVFLLAPSQSGVWRESFLHRFSGNGDGGRPAAGLLLDSLGNAYGVASEGGKPPLPTGVVFKLTAF